MRYVFVATYLMSSYCSMFLTEVSNVDGRLFEIFCWLVASMAVVIMAVYSLLLCDEIIGDVLFLQCVNQKKQHEGRQISALHEGGSGGGTSLWMATKRRRRRLDGQCIDLFTD